MHVMSIFDAIGPVFSGFSARFSALRLPRSSLAITAFAPNPAPGAPFALPGGIGMCSFATLSLLGEEFIGRVFPVIWTNKREEFIAFNR
jgi:hypothetical protein